ncbi:hypothetical protein ACGVWS_08295 [Enterobacteriaceae bacterium LUAb1]
MDLLLNNGWGNSGKLSSLYSAASKDKNEFTQRLGELQNNNWSCLIHKMRDINSANHVSYFNNLFNQQDVISASLISNKKTGTVHKAMGFEFALILSVPSENVIYASPHDLWFPNNIGTKKYNSLPGFGEYANELHSNQDINDKYKLSTYINNMYYKKPLLTPDSVLSQTIKYNEVIFTGKPHIGLRSYYTKKPKKLGLIVFQIEGHHLCFHSEAPKKIASQLNLPLYFIPVSARP